jgi:hypothetical protein
MLLLQRQRQRQLLPAPPILRHLSASAAAPTHCLRLYCSAFLNRMYCCMYCLPLQYHKCIKERGKDSGDCKPYMRAYR